MLENRHSQVRWSYFSTFSTAGMQLLAVVTLTRFLQPSDYGLAAIAMVCYSLTSYFTQLGMGRAIIQRPGLTHGNIRAAFTLSIATGLGGFLIACAIAPLLAIYFREPRLKWVFIVFSLNLVFQALSMTAGGLLRRDFRIRDMAICDFLGYLISTFGLGLPMAIKGYGVWALVASNVSQPFIVAVAYYVARPHSLLPTLHRDDYRHISRFGGRVTLATAIEAVGVSLDTLMLGRLVTPSILGIYNRAITLSVLPVHNLSGGLTRVFYPAIARAAESTRERCWQMLRSSEVQLMAIIAPTCIGAAVVASTIIPVALGKQWTAAIPTYQALCVVAMLDATMHLPGIQLEVLSLFRHKIYLQLLFIVAWASAILLTVRFGITTVALAYCALQLIRSVVFHWISANSLSTSLWSMVSSWVPGLACSGAIATALYFIQSFLHQESSIRPGLQLLLLIASGVILSILFYRIFYRESVYRPWVGLLRRQRSLI
jgi:O-antigen/teichoic acid export membrane protein